MHNFQSTYPNHTESLLQRMSLKRLRHKQKERLGKTQQRQGQMHIDL